MRFEPWPVALRTILASLAGRWIARAARPDTAALEAAAGLEPAVVVCGGSQGIGLAIAAEFLRDGRTVVIVARREAPLAEARSMLSALARGDGPRVQSIALDIADPDAPIRLAREIAALGLFTDVLVMAAGMGLAGPFLTQDPAELDRLNALNVTATTRLIRFALPGMIARARGGLLLVSSLGGYIPGPNQAAYYASKAYLCSLGEAVGSEVSGSGVRVTLVAPGPVNTDFHEKMGAARSPYRLLMPGLSPERAARSALWGYQLGRRVVVPGLLPKALAVAVCLLPHWTTRPVIGFLLRTDTTYGSNKTK